MQKSALLPQANDALYSMLDNAAHCTDAICRVGTMYSMAPMQRHARKTQHPKAPAVPILAPES